MYRYFIFAETWNCGKLKRKLRKKGILLICRIGSKERAYREIGIPDDDLYLTYLFLTTCLETQAEKCIAIVRDQRIEHLIRLALEGTIRYPGLRDPRIQQLKDRVEIVKVRFMSKPHEIRETIREIVRKLTKQEQHLETGQTL